jgi:DNA-binding FrmR family transcriptional regulator
MESIHIESPHLPRCDHNRATLNRIRRIQGQLASLENMIAADAGTCEERVVRTRTIEKAVASLMIHLVDCYVRNTVRLEIEDDPDRAMNDILRLVQLLKA